MLESAAAAASCKSKGMNGTVYKNVMDNETSKYFHLSCAHYWPNDITT